MSTIVVLGGGIGGLSAAFELKDELGDAHEIVLVSDQEHFEFTPSNPWVAVKWRKPEAIRLDLNELMPKHGIRFVAKAVRKVQPESHNLLLEERILRLRDHRHNAQHSNGFGFWVTLLTGVGICYLVV